eukprot:tig00000254_g22470.t1
MGLAGSPRAERLARCQQPPLKKLALFGALALLALACRVEAHGDHGAYAHIRGKPPSIGRSLLATAESATGAATKTYEAIRPASRCRAPSELMIVRAAAGNSTNKPFNLDTIQVSSLIKAANATFVDTRFATHYCIDGRHTHASVHTPGGDISEFLLALAAFQRVVLGGANISEEAVYAAMTAFIDAYAVPNERPFYMHTDHHSEEHLRNITGVNATYSFEKPPAADRDGLLRDKLVEPDTLGCGHLKRTLKNPDIYQTPEALTKAVIRAFFRALWRDHDAGTHAVEYMVLPGEHMEGSLVVMKGAACGDSVLTFVPNVPSHGQVFLYHPEALGHIRQTLARFLCDRKTDLGAAASAACHPSAILAAASTIFDAGLASTADALAKDRPQDVIHAGVTSGWAGVSTAQPAAIDSAAAGKAEAEAEKTRSKDACPVVDVTAQLVQAANVSDSAKLWRILSQDHAKAMLGKPPMVDVANHTWSCIDGRSEHHILGTPGGTISEFLLALSAFQRLGFTVDSEDTVQALLDAYAQEYTIPFKRQFYMHTDSHSHEAIAAALGVEPEKLDLSAPPAKLRPAVLTMSADPKYMGCGHVKLTIQNPSTYMTNSTVAVWAVRSFMRALWADKARGGGRFVLEVLEGDHLEGGILLIQSAGCAGKSAEVAPLVGPLTPNTPPPLGKGEAFVFHYADVHVLREWNAQFFASVATTPGISPAPLALALLHSADEAFVPQLGYTVAQLASGLPIFNDLVTGSAKLDLVAAVAAANATVGNRRMADRTRFTFELALPTLPCSGVTLARVNSIRANLAAKLGAAQQRVLVTAMRCEISGTARRRLASALSGFRRGARAEAAIEKDGTQTVLTVDLVGPAAGSSDSLTLDALVARLRNTVKYSTLSILGYGNPTVRLPPASSFPELPGANKTAYPAVAPQPRCSLLDNIAVNRAVPAGKHPANLSPDQVAALVKAGRPTFVDTRFATHYCIDGRHTRGSVHTPGGDISEFLLALAAFQRVVLGGAAISEDTVFAIMTAFIDTYAVPNERPFYLHTDEHSEEHLRGVLGKDASFDVANPPTAAERAAVLDAVIDPESLGCGHLKRTLKNPDIYQTPEALTKAVIRAFFRALWRDRDAGTGAVVYMVLPGDHMEGSVLVVSGAPCGDSVMTFAPNVPNQGQVFLYHPEALGHIRQTLARFLCDRKTDLGAAASAACLPSRVRAAAGPIFSAGFASTAAALAANRPQDILTLAAVNVAGLPGADSSVPDPADAAPAATETAVAAATAHGDAHSGGEQCAVMDVTAQLAQASKESDPAKLWRILSQDHAKAMLGKPPMVDVSGHTWSCIDGRSEEHILGTPGGTISEFLLALSAFQRLGFTIDSEDTVQALLDAYAQEYTIPFKRQFYMHTDSHAHEAMAAALGVEPAKLDLSAPPAKLRPAVLTMSADPKYIGCGHVKLTIQNPSTYMTDSTVAVWAVRSFMRALWADKARGGGRFVLEVLEGEHLEGAVILVQSAGCPGYAPIVEPMVGPLKPGEKPALGKGEAFVFHYADVHVLREWNAQFFGGPAVAAVAAGLPSRKPQLANVTRAALLSAMDAAFRPQLNATVGALASTLPQYVDTVTGEGDAELLHLLETAQKQTANLTQARGEKYTFGVRLELLPCTRVDAWTVTDVRAKLAAAVGIPAGRVWATGISCSLGPAAARHRQRRRLSNEGGSSTAAAKTPAPTPSPLPPGPSVTLGMDITGPTTKEDRVSIDDVIATLRATSNLNLPGYHARTVVPAASAYRSSEPKSEGSGGVNPAAIAVPVVLGTVLIAAVAFGVWRYKSRRNVSFKDNKKGGEEARGATPAPGPKIAFAGGAGPARAAFPAAAGDGGSAAGAAGTAVSSGLGLPTLEMPPLAAPAALPNSM